MGHILYVSLYPKPCEGSVKDTCYFLFTLSDTIFLTLLHVGCCERTLSLPSDMAFVGMYATLCTVSTDARIWNPPDE